MNNKINKINENKILKTIYKNDKFYFPVVGYMNSSGINDKEISDNYVKKWKLRERLEENPEKFDIMYD